MTKKQDSKPNGTGPEAGADALQAADNKMSQFWAQIDLLRGRSGLHSSRAGSGQSRGTGAAATTPFVNERVKLAETLCFNVLRKAERIAQAVEQALDLEPQALAAPPYDQVKYTTTFLMSSCTQERIAQAVEQALDLEPQVLAALPEQKQHSSLITSEHRS